MARRSMTVYLNSAVPENRVRTFGGNGSDVRNKVQLYKNMSKELFIAMHPKFAEQAEKEFRLIVHYN